MPVTVPTHRARRLTALCSAAFLRSGRLTVFSGRAVLAAAALSQRDGGQTLITAVDHQREVACPAVARLLLEGTRENCHLVGRSICR